MKNKTLIWAIVFVLILVAASVSYIFFIGSDKPDTVSVQCAYFCETGQEAGFCSFKIDVSENLKVTCYELATNSQYAQYNVAACPEISCENSGGTSGQTDEKTCVSGLNSEWVDADENGECPEKENMFSMKRDPSDEPPSAGQICCFYYE